MASTHALGMAGQLHAVGGVVAANMSNDGDLALGLAHHGFQNGLALVHMLVDALAGGAAHIHALDALGDQVAGEGLDALHRDVALSVIAGVKGREHTLIFGDIFHVSNPSLIIIVSCIKLVRFPVRAAASAPSCGALHPLRPLGGSCVLQTAAPKISPCFGRRPGRNFSP